MYYFAWLVYENFTNPGLCAWL